MGIWGYASKKTGTQHGGFRLGVPFKSARKGGVGTKMKVESLRTKHPVHERPPYLPLCRQVPGLWARERGVGAQKMIAGAYLAGLVGSPCLDTSDPFTPGRSQ